MPYVQLSFSFGHGEPWVGTISGQPLSPPVELDVATAPLAPPAPEVLVVPDTEAAA